ncbi:hypothetical protein ACS5PK_17910 [Roseateles sp. DB2]|uniref:hypothetical protein n=1 Tax=Roseateles sp. DB2 TaxID=3453717 RepID=UPI003EED9D9A
MQNFLDEHALSLYARYHEEPGSSPLLSAQRFDERLKALHPAEWRASFPPPLFRPGIVDEIGQRCATLLKIVYSLPDRLFDGDATQLLAAQGLPEERVAALSRYCKPRLLERARLFARPDALLTHDGFQLVEMNVTPSLGGLGICDRYLAEFRNDALGQRLQADGIQVEAPDMAAHFAKLMASAATVGVPGHRVMLELIADPKEDPDDNWARPDFIATAQRAGFDVITGKPGDVVIRSEGVFAKGRRIDLVYSDHVYAEQLMHSHDPALIDGLVDAEERGLIDLISAPPSCALYDNKANLALLTDPRHATSFSADERALIAAHVPRTQVLRPEILAQCLEERASLVLKPGLGLCGNGVVFGRKLDEQSWRQALESALASRESWVVQTLIERLWTYNLPHWAGEGRRMICMGPLVFDGLYTGTFLREDWFSGGPVVVNHAQGASWCAALQRAAC